LISLSRDWPISGLAIKLPEIELLPFQWRRSPAPRAGLSIFNESSDGIGLMAVERLGHVAIRVEEMGRAKAFYQSLGLCITWDADDWCYLQSPSTGDGIALLSADYRAAGPHFAFHFSDRAELDRLHAQLEAQGQSCGPVHDHRDGTASFYLRDPEGNWLEMLYEPAAGIPSNLPGQAPIPVAMPPAVPAVIAAVIPGPVAG
jgi:catechol 2,3-dioxygenase-like lactoylglutathione lyase family enzyme